MALIPVDKNINFYSDPKTGFLVCRDLDGELRVFAPPSGLNVGSQPLLQHPLGAVVGLAVLEAKVSYLEMEAAEAKEGLDTTT